VAGDPLKPVTAGERFKPTARGWNLILDHVRQGQPGGPGAVPDLALPSGIVPVLNHVEVPGGTETDVDRFGIVGICNAMFSYDPEGDDDDNAEFYNRPSLIGGKPAAGSPFAILQEPAAYGEIVRGMVVGVTPVKIDVFDELDKYADVVPVMYDADDTSTHLCTNPHGAARILWKEPGTGVKWGYVQFPAPAPQFFWATLGYIWGNPGDAEAPFCYDFTEVGGTGRHGYCWAARQLTTIGQPPPTGNVIVAVTEMPHYRKAPYEANAIPDYAPKRITNYTPPYTYATGAAMPNWYRSGDDCLLWPD